MIRALKIFVLLTLLSTVSSVGQGLITNAEIDTLSVQSKNYEPLAPSRAAFYSAVLPGLGQAYNKKYWKIPIIYGALGTGVLVYDDNNKNYKRARTAYKLRQQGKPDEFDGMNGNIFLSEDALVSAQKSYKKDRDLSLLVTVALYFLQILEASTNAHLLQHDVDNNLTLSPKLIKQSFSDNSMIGASISLKF